MSKKYEIIGGGPSGVTIGFFLKYIFGCDADVTIYERDEIGGQSHTIKIDEKDFETGTVFITPGYTVVRKLANEVAMTEGIIYPTQVRSGNDIHDIQLTTMGMLYVFLMTLTYFLWVPFRYFFSRSKYLGMKFSEYLSKIGMYPTSDEFITVCGTKQLYGPPDTITLDNALWWQKPTLWMIKIFPGFMGHGRSYSEGFGTLWKRLISKAEIKVVNEERTLATLHKDSVKFDTRVPQDCGQFNSRKILSLYVRLNKTKVGSCGYYFFDSKIINSLITRADVYASDQIYVPYWILSSGGFDETMEELKQFDIQGEAIYRRESIYNYHFSQQQIIDGVPSIIENAQGRNGVYRSGGWLTHWNVDDITDYNLSLVRKHVLSRKDLTLKQWFRAYFLPLKYLSIRF